MYLYPEKVEKVGLDPFLPDPVVQIATLTQMKVHTGKSLPEALLFCRTWEEHVVYKNCSECQKQFLYTTRSPQV